MILECFPHEIRLAAARQAGVAGETSNFTGPEQYSVVRRISAYLRVTAAWSNARFLNSKFALLSKQEHIRAEVLPERFLAGCVAAA